MSKNQIGTAILCLAGLLAPPSAYATTDLRVTLVEAATSTEPSGITASWAQSAEPVSSGYEIGVGVIVPVWGFTADLGPFGGTLTGVNSLQFNNGTDAEKYAQPTLSEPPYFYIAFFGPQLYSGSEAAPIFSPGVFTGYGYPAFGTTTITFTDAPEISTWAMMLIGFTGLGFAAMRKRNKASRFAAA